MRVAGNRGNPPRFSGVVSAAPGGVDAAFESCRQPRKPSSLLRSRFGGPGGVKTAFESCWQPGIAFSLLRSRFGALGALRRLLRVAGNLGNPSRFSGAVSAAPGGVETAFESCRQPRKPSSLLRSRFGGSGGRRSGFSGLPATAGNPPRFFGVVSAAPGGVEAAFERCRLPLILFSLLWSRFGGSGGR